MALSVCTVCSIFFRWQINFNFFNLQNLTFDSISVESAEANRIIIPYDVTFHGTVDEKMACLIRENLLQKSIQTCFNFRPKTATDSYFFLFTMNRAVYRCCTAFVYVPDSSAQRVEFSRDGGCGSCDQLLSPSKIAEQIRSINEWVKCGIE